MTTFPHKYPPHTLDECIFPDAHNKQRIDDYVTGIRTGSVLLYGPNGTGKSTTAKLIVEAALGKAQVDDNRDIISGTTLSPTAIDNLYMTWNAQLYFASCHRGWVVIEEVDRLSISLQQRLASVIDKWHNLGSIVFTTNYKGNIDPALVHRCDAIEFPTPSAHAMLKRAQQILSAEGITVSSDKVLKVLEPTDGSIRKRMEALEDLCIEHRRARAPKSVPQPATP